MVKEDGLLYIEPSAGTSREPLIDSLTRKMTAAFRGAVPCRLAYRGVHICVCGVRSSNRDYILSNGEETNSLCIHYLAFHRCEVPDFQLAKVEALGCGEGDPTEEELKRPK